MNEDPADPAIIEREPARWLDRGEGRVAYEVAGEGPLVVCVPGMGQTRGIFRRTAPALLDSGFRVASMDLRGHGGSDAGFSAYDDVAAAGDVIALVEALGGPAVLVGNSMGAGAAVIAAADRPDLVAGLVLVGPFVRDPRANPLLALAQRVLMAGPWARAAWLSYLPKLYPGNRPDDFAQHRQAILESMRRPGHTEAFQKTTRTSHSPAEARLEGVRAPVLVVMGERDPDFRDPAGEARWIKERLGADVVDVPRAGHYPHDEYPELVNPAVVAFVQRAFSRA